MNQINCDYTVRCNTCRRQFTVQLFESHEKNLFLVDKKDWYCADCKKEYSRRQTEKRSKAHQAIGYPELTGTPKMISWGEKIRAELINKANYLKQSLTFPSDEERLESDRAFELFFSEWQAKPEAKWWIDHRTMTIRDMSKRIEELSDSLRKTESTGMMDD